MVHQKTLEQLEAWVERDPGARRFRIQYYGRHIFYATHMRRGWEVSLFSWLVPGPPLITQAHSATLEGAVGIALRAAGKRGLKT